MKVFALYIVLLSIFEANGQEIPPDSMTNLQGTWLGVVAQNEGETLKMSTVVWRIHNIDPDKGEIELTQISHFDDSTTITEPEKAIYEGGIHNSDFWVILKDSHKNPIKFNFRISSDEESYLLTNQTKTDNHEHLFNMAKLDSDTSTYVKPAIPIEVRLTAPPPAPNGIHSSEQSTD